MIPEQQLRSYLSWLGRSFYIWLVLFYFLHPHRWSFSHKCIKSFPFILHKLWLLSDLYSTDLLISSSYIKFHLQAHCLKFSSSLWVHTCTKAYYISSSRRRLSSHQSWLRWFYNLIQHLSNGCNPCQHWFSSWD